MGTRRVRHEPFLFDTQLHLFERGWKCHLAARLVGRQATVVPEISLKHQETVDSLFSASLGRYFTSRTSLPLSLYCSSSTRPRDMRMPKPPSRMPIDSRTVM